MKVNLPVSNNMQEFNEDTILVSTTDLKGVMTSANKDFVDISGYSRDELVGTSHNIVRHPDMPPAAFADLWETLKAGKSWMGIVKNRCRNGDHYWVDAYVAPLYENGQLVAYQSVRVKPQIERVKRAEKLYARIQKGKPLTRHWLPRFGLLHKIWLGSGLGLLVTTGMIVLLGSESVFNIVVSMLTGAIVAGIFSFYTLRPLISLANKARDINNNPIMRAVYSGRDDEIGDLESSMVMLEGTLTTVIKRVDQFAEELGTMSNDASNTSKQAGEFALQQESEINMIASAVNEMSSNTEEVANIAMDAANAAESADEQARTGQQEVNKTTETMSTLANEVENVVSVVQKLEEASINIGSVLDVIRGIADQTNLLALNAAIEAARAGEQGRGFAVVADEVRTLANRTQESTQEIQNLIEQLQTSARASVDAMARGGEHTKMSLEQANKAGEALNEITKAVNNISVLNKQIAAASNEQGNVSSMLNENVQRITIMSQDAAQKSQLASKKNNELVEVSNNLDELVQHSGIRGVR